MLFKRKNEKRIQETRKKVEKLTSEMAQIWNGDNDEIKSDVNGSYTGNPTEFERPVQDADDL